jgi:hypothetical protein
VELIKFNPREVVKRDLLVLANYLESLSENYEHFNMGVYLGVSCVHLSEDERADIGGFSKIDHKVYKEITGFSEYTTPEKFFSCDTVACVIGHTKLLQLEGIDTAEASWTDLRDYLSDNYARVDKWMFDPDWDKVDNSPKGAAKRIRYALEFGVPADLDKRVTASLLKKVFAGTKYAEKFEQVEKLDITDRLVLPGANRHDS